MKRIALLLGLIGISPIQALPPAPIVYVQRISGVVTECQGEIAEDPGGMKFGFYWVWLKDTEAANADEADRLYSVLDTRTQLNVDEHRKPNADELLLVFPVGYYDCPELEAFEPGDYVTVSGYGVWPDELSEDPTSGHPSFQRVVVTRRNKDEQGRAGQPATRSESNSEGGDKTQPESEGGSR